MSRQRQKRPLVRGARVLVDSSAWLAFVSADDREHSKVDAAFQAAVFGGMRLLTTNLIVAEVQRLLVFRAGQKAARAFLERLIASKSTTLHFASRENHRAAIGWLDRLQDQALSYTDAVSFSVMVSTRCEAVMTLDKHFSIAGFTRFQDLL